MVLEGKVRGIRYDKRDNLWEACVQHKTIRYRKRFKDQSKAEEWLSQQKLLLKQNGSTTSE
jgi:hypothetical protein